VLLWGFLLVMSILTICERAVQMFGKAVQLPSGSHLHNVADIDRESRCRIGYYSDVQHAAQLWFRF